MCLFRDEARNKCRGGGQDFMCIYFPISIFFFGKWNIFIQKTPKGCHPCTKGTLSLKNRAYPVHKIKNRQESSPKHSVPTIQILKKYNLNSWCPIAFQISIITTEKKENKKKRKKKATKVWQLSLLILLKRTSFLNFFNDCQAFY